MRLFSMKKLKPALALGLAMSFFISACSTPKAARTIASENPLTAEQIATLEEAGVMILKLSLASNHYARAENIKTELKTKLENIDVNGKSAWGRAGVISVITLFAQWTLNLSFAMSTTTNYWMSVSDAKAFARGIGPIPTTSVYIVGTAGTLLSSSEAFGSSTFYRKKQASSAEKKAAKASAKEELDFNATVDRLAGHYAKIFSLEPAELLKLKQMIRTEIERQGKGKPADTKIAIDVPLLMKDSKPQLISDEDYAHFQDVLAGLNKAAQSDSDIEKAVDGSQFGENRALASNTLKTYIDWLKEAQPTLSAKDQARVKAILSKAELLQSRLNKS